MLFLLSVGISVSGRVCLESRGVRFFDCKEARSGDFEHVFDVHDTFDVGVFLG